MLQRVGIGQSRFNVPGLTVDNRGVVVGRQIVLRFSAMERLVSFLRLWSAEQSLDDFQPGLRLTQVRALGGSREVLVVVPVTSLPLVDATARAARVAGGQCFTGAGKHFVQYRDSQAPLGYDVDALETAAVGTDFILYGAEHTNAYAITGELPLDKLLLRLDLQRQHGATATHRELLFLTVRRGLGPLVIAYLHRAERRNPTLRVGATLCEPPAEGNFQRAATFWILRIENLPARLLGVLSDIPGLNLLVPVADNVAIALGYRHPVHLGSCKHVFPSDRMFLFGPSPSGVTVINSVPVFAPLADLVRLQVGVQRAETPPREVLATDTSNADFSQVTMARPASPRELIMPLRLEAAPAGVGHAVATLVPWDRLVWVRSMCYALPASAVRGYRLALLERGLLVIALDVLDAFPFGQLLHAPAPGLLVPLGWELRPAISPAELATRLGASDGSLVVFPGPNEEPFRVPRDSIVTLEARALADPRLNNLRTETSIGSAVSDADPTEILIENRPLGPMPLWRSNR